MPAGPIRCPHAEVDVTREDDDISVRHPRREGGELVMQVGEGVNPHREYLLQLMPASNVQNLHIAMSEGEAPG